MFHAVFFFLFALCMASIHNYILYKALSKAKNDIIIKSFGSHCEYSNFFKYFTAVKKDPGKIETYRTIYISLNDIPSGKSSFLRNTQFGGQIHQVGQLTSSQLMIERCQL